jgi:hypothetical protein
MFNITRSARSAGKRDPDMSSNRPDSEWRVEMRATADGHVYPSRLPAESNEALRRRHHYIYPREDSGTHMSSSDSEYRREAQSNPFEDARYEYGASVSEKQPLHERSKALQYLPFDSCASVTTAKSRDGKGYRRRLRDRVRAVFTSSTRATSERERFDAATTLLRGEGTHLGRGTMRR